MEDKERDTRRGKEEENGWKEGKAEKKSYFAPLHFSVTVAIAYDSVLRNPLKTQHGIEQTPFPELREPKGGQGWGGNPGRNATPSQTKSRGKLSSQPLRQRGCQDVATTPGNSGMPPRGMSPVCSHPPLTFFSSSPPPCLLASRLSFLTQSPVLPLL